MSDSFLVPFISKNGIRGKVMTASRLLDDTLEKSVVFETGRKAVVGSDYLHLREDGSYYLDLNVDPRPPDTLDEPGVIGETIIPRVEEQLVISKRVVETGRVRVVKNLVEQPHLIDETIVYEDYTVERVPINREVFEIGPTRVEGDLTIIPVYEEEVIVSKRLVLREEIHLIKKRREEHHPRTIMLRKQEVKIHRLDAEGRPQPTNN